MEFEKTYEYNNRNIEVCVKQKEALHTVSINVIADSWEEANEILYNFAKDKLVDIMKELKLTIINLSNADTYLRWYYVYFTADYTQSFETWGNMFNSITKRLYECGNEMIVDYSNYSRFEYDRLKAEYNLLLAQLMEIGYELKPKAMDDIIEETFNESDSN